MLNESTLIIAEAGVNHNGDLNLAKELIDCAADANADVVKFQTFQADQLSTVKAPKAQYQLLTTDKKENQFDMLKRLQLSHNDHHQLKEHADKRGIEFLSTAFDLPSIEFLKSLGLNRMKIPSGEITNYPYLVAIARTDLPIILSSGMCTIDEIKQAIQVIYGQTTNNQITVLHCTTAYPTPYSDVNLTALQSIKEELNLAVGYSDHTDGIEVAISAVSLGASIIEKHFTLDRSLPGPDHQASLEPDDLSQMVKAIRNIELALGNGIKKPQPSEKANIEIARKSLFAMIPIKKGEILTEENITAKRPGNGLSPMLWPKVIGTKAIRDFKTDELIEL